MPAMPELPEVETTVRRFRPRLEGRVIEAFGCRWAPQAQPSVRAVRAGVVGRQVRRLWRRGKYLVADLAAPGGDDAGCLLIHLRMSGRLEWADDRVQPLPRHARSWWDLGGSGRLVLCDARKFARVWYVRSAGQVVGRLGVEPLERGFTARRLGRLLRGRSRQLKPLLLDQSVVAGLGNIYVDEALFAAGLHPTASSRDLSDDQVARLHTAIRQVLRRAIRHNGTSFDAVYPEGGMERYLKVYGRAGQQCPRCRATIERIVVAQRGTHVCPVCQPPPRRK